MDCLAAREVWSAPIADLAEEHPVLAASVAQKTVAGLDGSFQAVEGPLGGRELGVGCGRGLGRGRYKDTKDRGRGLIEAGGLTEAVGLRARWGGGWGGG